MSLLTKFNQLTVTAEDRISEEDKKYLERYQELYEEALNYYRTIYNLYHEHKAKHVKQEQELYGTYNNVFCGNLGVCKEITSLQNGFVSHIYSYFKRKYNVELDEEREKDEREYGYDYHTGTINIEILSYKPYVDKIINSLGGLSFEDIHVQQLKDDIRKFAFNNYKGEATYSIKGNTIKFDHLVYWSSYYSDGYRSEMNDFKTLARSFGYYEYKISGFYYSSLDQVMGYRTEFQDVSDTIIINSNVFESVKFFKNGRVDLKFKTAEHARRYAQEWLGSSVVAA